MKRIGITIGDPAGIGPEVILKSINKLRRIEEARFIIFTPSDFLEEYSRRIKMDFSLPTLKNIEHTEKKIIILEVIKKIPIQLGNPTKITGDTAYKIIKRGIGLALDKKIDALVTAPVSKYAINLSGRRFTGHTEMLKRITDVKDVLMFFVSPELKAGVITTHIGIRNVSKMITEERILSKLLLLSDGLRRYFSVKHPKIGLSALNPHSGEAGYIGREEINTIKPTVEKAKSIGLNVEGPFPSDTILLKRDNFDALLFMYHDQAMIPVKLLSWGKNVNVTLGLPFIRTSPDHGTAFDIAGKGIASPDSFLESVKLACRMLQNRKFEDKLQRK